MDPWGLPRRHLATANPTGPCPGWWSTCRARPREASTSTSRLKAVVLGTIHHVEPHEVAGRKQKRLRTRIVERHERRPPDDLPSTRAVARVNAGLRTGDPDRSSRNVLPGDQQPRRGDP